MPVRSSSAGGRRVAPKFRPTIRSVPPAIGTASGCSAFAASASAHVVGLMKSMGGQYTGASDGRIRPRRTKLRLPVPWALEDPPKKGTPVRLSALVEVVDGGLIAVPPPARLLPAHGGHDPDVRAVVTTDLLDPRRYLSGGELVLTGLAWWRPTRPGRSRGFVAALTTARRGGAGGRRGRVRRRPG